MTSELNTLSTKIEALADKFVDKIEVMLKGSTAPKDIQNLTSALADLANSRARLAEAASGGSGIGTGALGILEKALGRFPEEVTKNQENDD
jgi:hypothetical protein